MEAFDETENFHTAIKLILLRFIVKTSEFCAKIQFLLVRRAWGE